MNNFKINSSGILLGVSELVFIAFPMLSMIVLNSFLTTAQYGELVYSFTLCSFYAMFVVFGVDILGSRLIHESETAIMVYREITIFKAINFIIGLLPFVIILHYLDSLQNTIIFLPVVISEVFGLAVYYLGRDETRKLLIYRLLSKGVGVLSLTFFLISGIGPLSYPISLFCTMIIDAILHVFLVRGRWNVSFGRKTYLNYLKDAWPLAASSMLVLGVSGGARVYVNNIFGSATLGLYDIIDRIVRGFKVVQMIYNKYLVTVMTESPEDILRYFKNSLILNVVLTAFLYALSYSVLPCILGETDLLEVMKYLHLILTVLWVGVSQYLSFLLAIVLRKAFFQLASLVLGFAIFHSLIAFVEIDSIESLVYLVNINEIVVLLLLAIVGYRNFKKRNLLTDEGTRI